MCWSKSEEVRGLVSDAGSLATRALLERPRRVPLVGSPGRRRLTPGLGPEKRATFPLPGLLNIMATTGQRSSKGHCAVPHDFRRQHSSRFHRMRLSMEVIAGTGFPVVRRSFDRGRERPGPLQMVRTRPPCMDLSGPPPRCSPLSLCQGPRPTDACPRYRTALRPPLCGGETPLPLPHAPRHW